MNSTPTVGNVFETRFSLRPRIHSWGKCGNYFVFAALHILMTDTQLTFVGHATILIEFDGVRLLTDPILRDKVMHLRRRTQVFETAWYRDIDAVLLSHLHYDHLDFPSLELLRDDTKMIVPTGMGAMLQRRGFENIQELALDAVTSIGPVSITATRADHDRARFRYGPAADTLGFVISGSSTIYFPGDTDIFPEMKDIATSLDVALMPVWGWGPTLGKGHLDPYRAALALQLLKPRIAIPIHWGTLYPFGMNLLNPDFLFDPPHSFARHAADLSPQVEVKILQPGETCTIEAATGQ